MKITRMAINIDPRHSQRIEFQYRNMSIDRSVVKGIYMENWLLAYVIPRKIVKHFLPTCLLYYEKNLEHKFPSPVNDRPDLIS